MFGSEGFEPSHAHLAVAALLRRVKFASRRAEQNVGRQTGSERGETLGGIHPENSSNATSPMYSIEKGSLWSIMHATARDVSVEETGAELGLPSRAIFLTVVAVNLSDASHGRHRHVAQRRSRTEVRDSRAVQGEGRSHALNAGEGRS